MQSHMAILIAYFIGMKKDHQTLLNFAVLAENGIKRTFSYKVACKKNFHGRAKGGDAGIAALLRAMSVVAVGNAATLWNSALHG